MPMLKKAAWIALKIEAGLFSIVVAAAILTNVLFHPGPHSGSLIFVHLTLLSQFAGVAVVFWLLPGDIHIVLAAPIVFVVQYLTYTAIVFLVLLWRANP